MRRSDPRCIAPSCPTRWECRPISKSFRGGLRLTTPSPQTGKDARAPVVCCSLTRQASKPARGRPCKHRDSGDSCRSATARIRLGAPGSMPSVSHPPTTGGPPDGSPPRCGVMRTRSRAHAAHQVLPGRSALHDRAARARAPGPSAVCHRAAVPRTQRRDRARPLRRPQPAGLATPRGLDHDRLQLPQNERRRRGQTQLTLPRVRTVIQEILTAHFFMTQSRYLKWMLKLKDVKLQI